MKLVNHVFIFIIFTISTGFSQTNVLVPFEKDALWGYRDTSGNMIIEPQYSEALPFAGNMAVIKKDDHYGIIDRNNKLLLKPDYETIELGAGFAILSKKDRAGQLKQGCFHEVYGLLLEPVYEQVNLNDHFILFKSGLKWGVVTLSTSASPPVALYDVITRIEVLPAIKASSQLETVFLDAQKKTITSKAGKVFEMDRLKGNTAIALAKVLTVDGSVKHVLFQVEGSNISYEIAVFDELDDQNTGFTSDGLYEVKLNGKSGLVDSLGRVVLATVYEDVIDQYKGKVFKVKLNGSIVLVNTKGENILPAGYTISSGLYIPSYSGIYLIEDHSGDQRVIRLDDNTAISDNWKVKRGKVDAVYCCPTDAIAIQKGRQKKLYDPDGKPLIRKGYHRFKLLDNGLYLAYSSDRFHIYYNGEKIAHEWFYTYDSLKEDVTENMIIKQGLLSFKQGDLWGILDFNGDFLLPFISEQRPQIEGDLFIISRNQKKGIVDRNGTIVAPAEFDQINILTESLYAVQKGDLYFFLKRGETVSAESFEGIYSNTNRVIKIKQNGKFGLFAMSGDRITTSTYDSFEALGNDLFLVSERNLFGIYSLSAQKMLVSCEYNRIEGVGSGAFKLTRNATSGIWTKEKGLVIPAVYTNIVFHEDIIELQDAQGNKIFIYDILR